MLKQGELRRSWPSKGRGNGGLGTVLKPMFPEGGLEQLCNDIPGFPITHMAFKKGSFSDLPFSHLFETGKNFLDSVGEMVRHPFNKDLFHVVVQTKQDIGCMLGSGIAGSR